MPTMRLSQRLWLLSRGDLRSMCWSAPGRRAAPVRIRRGSRVPPRPVLQSPVWRSAAGRRTLDGREGVEDVAPVLSARKPRSWWQGDRAGGRLTVFLARTRASGGRHSAPRGQLPEGCFRFDQDGCCRRPRDLGAGLRGELWEQVSVLEVSKRPGTHPVEPRGPRLPEAGSVRPVESRESRCPAWNAGPRPGCPPPRSGEGLGPVATSSGRACARARCDSEAEEAGERARRR